MKELRFQIRNIPPGKAARQVEAEHDSDGHRPSLQVRAGSSARAAEEQKRAEGSVPSRQAGFSLRAQGGRVMGSKADLQAAETSRAAQRSQLARSEEVATQQRSQAAAGACIERLPTRATPEAAQPVTGGITKPSAGLLHGVAERLRTLFRGAGPGGSSL